MVKQFEKKFKKEHKHDKSDLNRIHELEKKLKEEYKQRDEQAEIHENISESDAIKDLDHSVDQEKKNRKTYLKRAIKNKSQDDEQTAIDNKMEKLNEQEEAIEAQKAQLRNKLMEGKKSTSEEIENKDKLSHYDSLAQKAIKHAQSLQQQYKRIDGPDEDDDNDDDSNVQTQVNTFVNNDIYADAADFYDKY